MAVSCQTPKEEGDYNVREPISTATGLDVIITITEERFSEPAEIRVDGDEFPKVVRDWNSQEMLEYRVGPGDKLAIKIYYGLESFGMDVVVGRDGNISLPLIGKVDVQEKTPEELEAILFEKFEVYYVNPAVLVIVTEFNSHRVYVTGLGMGSTEIQLEKRTTLFEILPQLRIRNADMRGAYLQRGDKIYPLDLKQLIEGDLSNNYELEDNDIIYIRSMRNLRIFVMGEVRRAGVMPLKTDDNLFYALLRAGGPTSRAQIHDIRIIRGGLTNPTLITVDLKVMFTRKAPRILTTEDFHRLHVSVEASRHSSLSLEKLYLQNEDLIFVPRTVLAHWNDIMREVSPAIRFLLTEPILITRDTILLQNTLAP